MNSPKILNVTIRTIIILIIFLASELQAQTISATNTAPACDNCAPPGWSVISGSTDISNSTYWAGRINYPWVGTVVNPPNNHTLWVTGFYNEVSGANITGLTPGINYDFDFYKSELQSTAGGPVIINFDGVLRIYDCNTGVTFGTFPFSGGANNAWTLSTLSFTATSTVQSLCFSYNTNDGINGNFWNVSFGGNVVNPTCDMLTAVAAVPIFCNGVPTGAASVTAINGTPPYTYLWSNGSTSPSINGLAAGTYNVTVTDAGNCKEVTQAVITEPSALQLTIQGETVPCTSDPGIAAATVVGGTPGYSYLWSNGQTTSIASGLTTGTYSLTVTDNNGCKIIESVAITQPSRITILFDVVNVGCDSPDDGTATAINIGGLPPISYQWDANANNQTTSTANNLTIGAYYVTLVDANGCSTIAGTTVNKKDCGLPCPVDPCVEAVINNTNICSAIASDPADPLSTLDCDSDGVINATECTDGTDPLDPCDYVDTSITLPVTADQSGCPVPCPDLTAVSTILPGNIAGFSAVEVAVQVTELNTIDTDGTIVTVRIPADPRFAFVWNIGLTMSALVPVQNADWNYLGSNGFLHSWTYNGNGLIIPGGSVSAFGFQGFYDPQATDGQTTITATILPYSGGECNALNNTDSERMVYFQ